MIIMILIFPCTKYVNDNNDDNGFDFPLQKIF